MSHTDATRTHLHKWGAAIECPRLEGREHKRSPKGSRYERCFYQLHVLIVWTTGCQHLLMQRDVLTYRR